MSPTQLQHVLVTRLDVQDLPSITSGVTAHRAIRQNRRAAQ